MALIPDNPFPDMHWGKWGMLGNIREVSVDYNPRHLPAIIVRHRWGWTYWHEFGVYRMTLIRVTGFRTTKRKEWYSRIYRLKAPKRLVKWRNRRPLWY